MGHSVNQNLASHKGTTMQLMEDPAVNLGAPGTPALLKMSPVKLEIALAILASNE